MGKGLYIWVLIVASIVFAISSCATCGSTKVDYYVNNEPGFLILAKHELWGSGMHKNYGGVVGYDVECSGPDGRFTLSQPTPGFFGGTVVTTIAVSKQGYESYYGEANGVNADKDVVKGNRITLRPTKSFKEEYQSYVKIKDLDQNCSEVGRSACASIRRHLKSRLDYLLQHYPDDMRKKM